MGWTLSKGTKSQRLRSIAVCLWELPVRRVVVRRMARRDLRRQERRAPRALGRRNAAKLWRLVLNLFWHYLLFDRKSDVYDVLVSDALSG